jgi:hypothetical protein
MKRFSVLALATAAALVLTACSHGAVAHRAAVPSTPVYSSRPPGPIVPPTGTPEPTAPAEPSPLDDAIRRMVEVNTFRYVTELRTTGGLSLVREVGEVRLEPLVASYTRTVGSHTSVEVVAAGREAWVRSGGGCWQHQRAAASAYAPPGAAGAIMGAEGWRNVSGQTLHLGEQPRILTSGLGLDIIRQLGIPTRAPYGIVEVRATADDSGLVTSWETTLGELEAAAVKAGGHPAPWLTRIDAVFRTTLTPASADVDLDPPADDELCSGASV